MQKNRVIFDLGSRYFTVFADGKTLLRKPAAMIVKRSSCSSVVATGEEAIAKSNAVADDEMFIRPMRKGAVAHKTGCTVLVKEYLSEIFGKLAKPPLCILAGCALNPEQKNEIEHVFIDAGYTDLIFMEKLLGLAPALNDGKIKAAMIIGGEISEVGLFDGGRLFGGYSVDIGGNTVNERIIDLLKEKYKLIISDSEAEKLKIAASSLYPNDLSRFAVVGADAITGRGKKVTLNAKDIYPEVVYVYGRILKVAEAALTTAPDNILEIIRKTGILITGYGSLENGLREFAAHTLSIPVMLVSPDNNLSLVGANKLVSDEEFLKAYLRLSKK